MVSPESPVSSRAAAPRASSRDGDRKRHRRRSSSASAAPPGERARPAERAPPEGFVSVLGNGLVGAPLDSIGEPITGRTAAGVPGSASGGHPAVFRGGGDLIRPPGPIPAGPPGGGDYPDAADEEGADGGDGGGGGCVSRALFEEPEWREVRDAIARLERAVEDTRGSRAARGLPEKWDPSASASSSFLEDVFLHIFGGVLLLFILEQFVQIGILIGHKQYARAGLVPVNPDPYGQALTSSR